MNASEFDGCESSRLEKPPCGDIHGGEGRAEGRRRGAEVDVFVDEPLPVGHRLLDLPNALLSPHTGRGGCRPV